MIDKGHCMMSTDDFDEEYEPFYDFSGTYEENFIGKKIDDFDLTEELVARPTPGLKFAQVPEESIKEDEEWEDIDVVDDEEVQNSNSEFSMISNPNVKPAQSKSESQSEFTLITEEKAKSSKLSEFDQEKIHALEEISSHLNEKEAKEFIQKNAKGVHADVDAFLQHHKKLKILETGELLLPNGKIIGHRQFRHIYNQHFTVRDKKEAQIIQKLALEYKGMTTALVKRQNRIEIGKHQDHEKKFQYKARTDLNVNIRAEMINRRYFRIQNPK